MPLFSKRKNNTDSKDKQNTDERNQEQQQEKERPVLISPSLAKNIAETKKEVVLLFFVLVLVREMYVIYKSKKKNP